MNGAGAMSWVGKIFFNDRKTIIFLTHNKYPIRGLVTWLTDTYPKIQVFTSIPFRKAYHRGLQEMQSYYWSAI